MRWIVTLVNDDGESKKVTVHARGINEAMDEAEFKADPYCVGSWSAVLADVQETRSNPGTPRRNDASPRRRNKADSIFREWHDKDPRKDIGPIKVKDLGVSTFACVGKCEQIEYDSDKWEKDGELHSYYHDTTSKPGVWIPSTYAGEDERIGRDKSTSSLLGAKPGKGALWLAQLAFCTSLTYKDKSGEKLGMEISGKSKMLSTPDKKGVLILTRKGPVIVHGGSMRVTPRGLVK